MSWVAAIGALLIPTLIILVILFGFIKRINVYDAFVEGASRALPLILKILPYICAMTLSITVFRASGVLDFITSLLKPMTANVIPPELLPLILLRPFSGMASLALLSDVFHAYGADSFIGRAASVIVGASETIFYTIALYFGSVKVKYTRYTLPVALISACFAVFIALVVTGIFWPH